MTALRIITFGQWHDGTRKRQIDGFDGASVLVSGECSEAIAGAIVERFEQKAPPRRPLGDGGCVRIDDRGIWLCNRIASGWSSSSIRYESWRELLNDWDFRLGNPATDDAGVYWPIFARVVCP